MKTEKEFLPLELAAALLGKTKKDKLAESVNEKIREANRKRDEFILARRKTYEIPPEMTGKQFSQLKKYM